MVKMKTQIGVFDSGIGGRTTLEALRRELPEADFCYIVDREHHPYGEKADAELAEATAEVVTKLQDWGAKLVVIACNTATTKCIHQLRKLFPEITFVGTEPAIKLAADAGCQKILVLATPNTVTSEQVRRLIAANITDQEINLLGCPGLAELVEAEFGNATGELRAQPKLDQIRAYLETLLKDLDKESFDGVVLGCTHYVLLRELIQGLFPNAKIFDGNLGVAKHVKSLVGNAN